MANRYWTGAVNGGTGTWDTSNTANWSATSGGAGGASVPTSADDIFFDANSGAGVCTLGSDVVFRIGSFSNYTGTVAFSVFKMSTAYNGTTILALGSTATFTGSKRIELTYTGSTGTRTVSCTLTEQNVPDLFVVAGADIIAGGFRCRDLNFTGFSGSFTPAFQNIFGDIVLSPTMTVSSSTSPILFTSTSATARNLTSNGNTFNCSIRFSGVGGTWVLQDSLTIASTRLLRMINGTFDANNKSVTLGGFDLSTGTKTLVLGSGVWSVTGDNATFTVVWNANTASAGLTVNAGTATISMTSANAKTFAGGGFTWPTLNQGGAGGLIVQQSNTFANITNTVQPATITLTSGTTQTVTDFDVSGTSGNLVTLNASTPGSQATLTDSTGTNSVSFVDIEDIVATGGAVWEAYTDNGNVDGGNNVGWLFSPVVVPADDYVYEIRSFTEKRRF